MFFASTQRTRIAQTIFTFASPHIIVVLTPLICISFLSCGSRTAGLGPSRLHRVLICLPLQTTGSLPFTINSERPTCTVSHLLRLSGLTVKLPMPERMVRKLQSNLNCYSPTTTRTSCVCGGSQINLVLSRMHSTIILSLCIDHQAINLSTGHSRPAVTVLGITAMIQIQAPPPTDALPQPHTIIHRLSTQISRAQSLPHTTLLRVSLAEG